MSRRRLLITVAAACAIAAALIAAHRPPLLSPSPARMRATFQGDTRRILERSTEFTLLSLEPHFANPKSNPASLVFHGHPVLGRVEITDPRQKQDVIRALDDGIARASAPATCFSPRHGIHAIYGQHFVDLVICFQCGQIDVYWSGKPYLAYIAATPAGALNRVLTNAGVPLPSPPS